MKIDIEKIESGEEELRLRYREETGLVREILELMRRSDGPEGEAAGADGRREGGPGDRIYGKKDGETVFFAPGEILYIESVDDKLFAYTKEEVLRLEGTLAGILQRLGDERFFRCSKSMILNIEKVEKLHSLSSNRIDATLEGGEHILISRTYASEFRKLLKGGRT